jgi:hypothetical protein
MMTTRSQWLLFVIDSGNGGNCWWKRRLIAAAAVVVFVVSGPCQRRQQWDGGTLTQWHPRQWHLWPMVAESMAVVVVNCAAAVDAATTHPVIGVNGSGKDAIAATAINHPFH